MPFPRRTVFTLGVSRRDSLWFMNFSSYNRFSLHHWMLFYLFLRLLLEEIGRFNCGSKQIIFFFDVKFVFFTKNTYKIKNISQETYRSTSSANNASSSNSLSCNSGSAPAKISSSVDIFLKFEIIKLCCINLLRNYPQNIVISRIKLTKKHFSRKKCKKFCVRNAKINTSITRGGTQKIIYFCRKFFILKSFSKLLLSVEDKLVVFATKLYFLCQIWLDLLMPPKCINSDGCWRTMFRQLKPSSSTIEKNNNLSVL